MYEYEVSFKDEAFTACISKDSVVIQSKRFRLPYNSFFRHILSGELFQWDRLQETKDKATDWCKEVVRILEQPSFNNLKEKS